MTLEEAVAQFEGRFSEPAVDGAPMAFFSLSTPLPPCSLCGRGGADDEVWLRHFVYLTITSRGVKDQGDCCYPKPADARVSAEAAVAAWAAEASAYAESVGYDGRLHWRVRPVLTEEQDYRARKRHWFVYSRFVVVPAKALQKVLGDE